METLTNWQRLAREKFGSQVRIVGDGAFAVRTCHNVVLCDLEMRAQQIRAEHCDGPYCNHVMNPANGWHRIFLLVQKEAQRRRFRRIAGALDED